MQLVLKILLLHLEATELQTAGGRETAASSLFFNTFIDFLSKKSHIMIFFLFFFTFFVILTRKMSGIQNIFTLSLSHREGQGSRSSCSAAVELLGPVQAAISQSVEVEDDISRIKINK